MKIEREVLLKILDTAVVGITSKEILEQSNCFVFTDEDLVTFNGEVFTKTKNPLEGITGAVPAEDFRKILGKFPDEIVEITTKGEEIRIKGKRKEAGLTRAKGITLPYSEVPKPGEWTKIPPELMGTALQAARICGKDESQPSTTEVHFTPKMVEACDNYRLFRCEMKTGLEGEVLVAATSINAVGVLSFEKVSVSKTKDEKDKTVSWIHFKTKRDHRVSLRCSKGDYPPVSKLLDLTDPKKIKLPGNLSDIIHRAEVMQEAAIDSLVSVSIEDGALVLKAQKEGGWYKESKSIDYKGDPIRFEVNPAFLEEILGKTKKVVIGGNRMMIKSDDTVFVVCLSMSEEKED